MDNHSYKVSELVGKSVVSLSDGVKVGTVKDVLIDTGTMVAGALLVAGDSGRGGLPFAQITNIGQDAITIETAQAVFWASANTPGPGREAGEIKGLPVVDASGTVVGNVHDIDLLNNRVQSLIVRSGGVFGLGANDSVVPVSAIRSIGAKLVTVEVAPVGPQNP
ncbi:hypothetical protein BH11ARM2_BH11ARM2_26370 [soil metagenome]